MQSLKRIDSLNLQMDSAYCALSDYFGELFRLASKVLPVQFNIVEFSIVKFTLYEVRTTCEASSKHPRS